MAICTESEPLARRRAITPSRLCWPVVVFIALTHLGALLALTPRCFAWSGVGMAALLAWVSGGLGITLGYHRLLTHRSFRTSRVLEYLLTALGCLAWQGGPIQWVGTHRIHHRHSDGELDPHSPGHGFAWAHVFWCMHREPEGRDPEQAARDLARDPVHRLLNRLFWLPQFLLGALLLIAGHLAVDNGLAWLVWGLFVRTVVVYHGTWFVNSAAHTWGYRSYQTPDRSTNLWWVALLSFGEGWHNNHHAFQRSAAHGLRWFELDITYWTIWLLGRLGLARDIILPRPAQQART